MLVGAEYGTTPTAELSANWLNFGQEGNAAWTVENRGKTADPPTSSDRSTEERHNSDRGQGAPEKKIALVGGGGGERWVFRGWMPAKSTPRARQ